MGMQTDVKAGHLNNSGFVVLGRNRLKAVSMVGTATAGTLDIFDTTAAPVSATYERAATLITVTVEYIVRDSNGNANPPANQQ